LSDSRRFNFGLRDPARIGKRCATIEGPIDKSLGTKEALAVRLRKLAIDGEKTLQGVAELAYQQGFQV
jgi:hypothetical protein